MRRFLFKLNDLLYNWPCQLSIFLFWFFVLIKTGLVWFKIGLVIWIVLLIFRLLRKEVPEKSPILGWLVGLNIIVLFSVLTFPLLLFLKKE